MAQASGPSDSTSPVAPITGSSRYLTNVLWNLAGVAANLTVAILIQRYIIRILGAERYGLWTLIFSILDYFWFFDLGLNTAVANFCARYAATQESEKINEVINTAMFYFSVIGVVLTGIVLLGAGRIEALFPISPAYRGDFGFLIRLTGVAWGLCIVLHMFLSAMDGFQRFDLSNRVSVTIIIFRSVAYLLVLKAGYGLPAMGIVCVAFQAAGYIANFLNCRRVFPKLRFARNLVRLSVFKEIFSYGVRSFVANGSSLLLNQSGPVLIGHFLSAEHVGFYALPSRILQNAVDVVSRIGIVTRSNSAELHATGRREPLLNLAIYANRYSFVLFLPLVLILLPYGREIILRWVGPEYAAYSGPLLPIFLMSTALVLAGQFNSSSILFGLSKHGQYARGLMAEAALNVVGMILVIPRFGILGAACVSSGLMLLVRGIYTPYVLCRTLDYPLLSYLRQIYVRPALTGIPVVAFAYFIKPWIPGRNWGELIGMSVAIASLYAAAALFTCIEREHRAILLARAPIVGNRLAAATLVGQA